MFLPSTMSDSALLREADRAGAIVREWRARFAGLLPELASRSLYQKQNFASIETFAGFKCGMSRDAVKTVLRLHRRFENAPECRRLLVNGLLELSKLSLIPCHNITTNGFNHGAASILRPIRVHGCKCYDFIYRFIGSRGRYSFASLSVF